MAHSLAPAGTGIDVRRLHVPRTRTRARRANRYRAAGALIALAVLTGVLSAAAVAPVVGVVGIAVRNAARTFNTMPVPTYGRLPARSELVDSAGHLIAYYYPRDIFRVPVTYHQIAPVMREATVAIEDARFWQHGALDVRGTLRAILFTLSGWQVQGGSDIAQQYVRSACVLTARTTQQAAACTADTVARKLRELRIAAKVMHDVTRTQLLAAYLSAVYFGNQAYGVQVAAKLYFSVPASELSLPQAATLAGVLQDPAGDDPLLHPQEALDRRGVVLERMAKLGYITRAETALAGRQPLGLHVSRVPLQTGCTSPVARWAAFFCDYVLALMRGDPAYSAAWAALNTSGGLKVYTTVNTRDQRAANRAVKFVLPARSALYNPGHNVDTEVLIQPGTGYIRAIAVDRPFGNGRGQTSVDYAVNAAYGGSTGVQAGSSAKIFTLVTALKQGLPFGYHLKVTSPTTVGPYRNCQGGYVPRFHVVNAEGPQRPRTYTIYDATIESINAFYATLEQRIGLCDVVRTAVSMGLTRADGTSLLRRDPHLRRGDNLSADNYPSFTLGSVYVSPMSMADAYATVAARGIYCKPIAITAIVASNGKRLGVEPARCHRVMTAGVADAASYVLQGVLGSGGTAYNRGIGIPAAAKTGTANAGYYADFAGYTPRLAGYVSVFNPDTPTGAGAMVYPRADYREVDGLLATPGQMFGDNAPAATWQMTFLDLALSAVPFVYPPTYPFFNMPLHYKPPPKKHKHAPTPTPSPTATPSPTPTPTPTPTITRTPSMPTAEGTGRESAG